MALSNGVSRATRAMVLLLAIALTLASAPLPAHAEGRTLYVAPWGSDFLPNGWQPSPNSFSTPWKTIEQAIRRARPGDRIMIRGGTYQEVAGWGATPGTEESPITLENYKNERVIIQGQLQLVGADYWTVDGINVTYSAARGRTESLVKFDGGVGWRLLNSEIWGTRGVSNLMITGQDGEPRDYRISGNCIHDNLATGDAFMNDHNIYLQPGYDTGPGTIDRNILFNAPNGANIKAAGGNPRVTGAADVSIRHNTISRAGAGVIVGYASHDVAIQGNLFGPQIGGGGLYTAAVIGNTATGTGNHATGNAVFGYPQAVWSTADSTRPIREFQTKRVNTQFDEISCAGFRPTDAQAAQYGRYAVDSFRDDDASMFENEIENIASKGITRGCNPPTNDLFCPDDPVTRGQMAAFIRRTIDTPDASKDHFADDEGSTFESDINALAEAGIAKGCNPPKNDKFCPGSNVTRGEMAAFLVRAFHYSPSKTDHFVDDNNSTFESDINSLADSSVTRGCNPPANDRYCPNDAVPRGQMAAFLSRAAD